MDDEAENEATPVVDDDTPDTTNKSDKAEIEQTYVERTSGAMNLGRQQQKEYNLENYNNVFNITHKTQNNNGIILMQLKYEEDSDTFDVTKEKFDKVKAEYMFLTETLGWKEDIGGMDDTPSDADSNDVTKLAKYLFLTEQMGLYKGSKLFGERGEKAIKDALQQIHTTEGFKPKHWYELTKEERTKARRYLMYLKEKRDEGIKGRGCAGGQPWRTCTNKIDTSLPTA